MLVHLVARSLPGYKPFVDPAVSWWLMWRLRLAFPMALAACVMPDHVHLITTTLDPEEARRRVARILSVLTVRAGKEHLFQRLPTPEAIANGKHLERQIRYVHLNPARANLVSDPLCWPWSTHRGAVGAEVNPWTGADRLARALGRSTGGFSKWLHDYVSGDPSVAVGGSAAPFICTSRDVPAVPLDLVRRAALAASPWSPPTPRRELFVALARHQGWRDNDLIARAAGITSRSVRRILAGAGGTTPARAALLCLGDERLHLPDALIYPIGALPRNWVATATRARVELVHRAPRSISA